MINQIRLHNSAYFIQNYKKALADKVSFLAVMDEPKVRVFKGIKGDASFHLKPIKDHILKETGWESLKEFVLALESFIPCEKIEIENDFVNIWWSKEPLLYLLQRINKKNGGYLKLNYIKI